MESVTVDGKTYENWINMHAPGIKTREAQIVGPDIHLDHGFTVGESFSRSENDIIVIPRSTPTVDIAQKEEETYRYTFYVHDVGCLISHPRLCFDATPQQIKRLFFNDSDVFGGVRWESGGQSICTYTWQLVFFLLKLHLQPTWNSRASILYSNVRRLLLSQHCANIIVSYALLFEMEDSGGTWQGLYLLEDRKKSARHEFVEVFDNLSSSRQTIPLMLPFGSQQGVKRLWQSMAIIVTISKSLLNVVLVAKNACSYTEAQGQLAIEWKTEVGGVYSESTNTFGMIEAPMVTFRQTTRYFEESIKTKRLEFELDFCLVGFSLLMYIESENGSGGGNGGKKEFEHLELVLTINNHKEFTRRVYGKLDCFKIRRNWYAIPITTSASSVFPTNAGRATA